MTKSTQVENEKFRRGIELINDISFILNGESSSNIIFALSVSFHRSLKIIKPSHLNKDDLWQLMQNAGLVYDSLKMEDDEAIE
jgi:hypothetical protein